MLDNTKQEHTNNSRRDNLERERKEIYLPVYRQPRGKQAANEIKTEYKKGALKSHAYTHRVCEPSHNRRVYSALAVHPVL